MLRFAVRRLLNMVLIMFALSVLTFVIFNVIPGGDPALRIAGRNANEVQRERVREAWGFNEPLHVQYYEMMNRAVAGELISYSNQQNVREEIVRGIPATASLVIGAAAIWLFFGVLFGVVSAVYQGRWLDRTLNALALVGISLPVFWLGLMMVYYLTYRWPLFPSGPYVPLTQDPVGWLTHLILPWTALSILFIGFYSRLLRSNVLDVASDDYIRTARAKGLSERRILVRHTMRNALIPIVTLFGLDFAAAFGGGAILTESVFGLQGVGEYAADSIGSLDLPPILGVVLYGGFFIVLMGAIVDIAYAYLDPRIRLDG
jgi:peptide/nickel transport system permease protein